MSLTLSGPSDRNAGQRFPALVWSLLHAPLFLALYWPGVQAAVRATPEAFRAWLWPTFLPQAASLAVLAWLVAWPFSLVPRAYRWAAPAIAALVTFVVALDAQVYGSVGFHLNGFFFRVMLQANALKEAGVPLRSVVIFAAAAAAFAAVDVSLGSRFIDRFRSPRRAWTIALALLLVSTVERVYGALLVHFGGPSIFAASTVLPQPPVRMGSIATRIFGKRSGDPFQGSAASKRLPAGVAPDAIKLTRKPDVLFLITESLPAAHLDARTMPNLWRRAEGGARFLSHYSGASSTNYTLFTLMYGLQAQKLETIVGAGRRPVLFPALAANGYQVKVLAASCVDWMDLKDTVFGGVRAEDLRTWCVDVEPPDRDAAMLEEARAFARTADPDRPIFLFMFFFGTHFNYFHDKQDEVFLPEWDGMDALKATATSGERIENRARNAAHKVDRLVDGFLASFQQARGGREPLVVFTGDHGEEFRQKGHIGHGSAVTSEQIHVPAVWFGPGVPQGVHDEPTSHSDVVPTLLALLGDAHAPSLYADGMSMFAAPDDRFVCSTVGWEPHYAVIGKDLKVVMYAGLGTASITDPEDRPLPDGPLRMAKAAGRIMRALRGESAEVTAAAGDGKGPGTP